MHQNSSARQLGIALLEVLISLFLLGIVITGAVSMIDNHLEKVRMAATAEHMQVFAKGVKDFVKDNYPYLVSGGNNLEPASDQHPAVLTVNTLQTTPNAVTGQTSATRYLPAGFKPTNSYQQTICALVLKPKPNSNELYTLIVTESINPHAQNISDIDLSLLAASLGAAGGGIYQKDSDNDLLIAKGTMGKWEFDLKNDQVGQFFKSAQRNCADQKQPLKLEAGHPLMALWFAEDTSSAYLYRDEVPGHPELNTMQTDLKFSDDEIDADDPSKSRFGASVQLQIERVLGDRCEDTPTAGSPYNPKTKKREVPVGTLARNARGEILSCQQIGDGPENRIWMGPVTIGRWRFKLEYQGTKKSFVGTGYFIGDNQFNGLMHCDPDTQNNFDCGNAGNIDCSKESDQLDCAWKRAGNQAEKKYQVDVTRLEVLEAEQIWGPNP